MSKILYASATLAEVLNQPVSKEESEAISNGSGYFRWGWTNAKSVDDYKERLLKRKPAISGKYKFDPPRVVKPVKTLNNRRGVPIRSLYLDGKEECMIGKAPSVAKDVTFFVNNVCTSRTKIEHFEKFSAVILDAWDTLIESGYSPQFCFLVGSKLSEGQSIVKIDLPNVDREQIRYMICDSDSSRYVYFKAEDYFLSVDDLNCSTRVNAIHRLYNQNKGTILSLTKDHLLKVGINPQRAVGSFVALDGYKIDECIEQAKAQLQEGMYAL